MAMALYEPGLGYYAGARRKFGQMPSEGSDFVTAHRRCRRCSAARWRASSSQAMDASGCRDIIEFGAGSGALAAQLIAELDGFKRRAWHATASSSCRPSCASASASGWLTGATASTGSTNCLSEIEAVVIGNEVLDAMPVQLVAFDGQVWRERGVVSAG